MVQVRAYAGCLVSTPAPTDCVRDRHSLHLLHLLHSLHSLHSPPGSILVKGRVPGQHTCPYGLRPRSTLTPRTSFNPLTALTAWLKGRVLGQHTSPYRLRPRVTLTPLTPFAPLTPFTPHTTPITPLTPLTAWLKERVLGQHTCPILRTASEITTHAIHSTHSTHRLAQGGGVPGQHTCPYGLRPRSTLTPLSLLLTPLTAVLMTPNPMGVRNTSP